jgi:putative transposase
MSRKKRKSKKTVVTGDASVIKELRPYWTDKCAEMSSKLWLPTKTLIAEVASAVCNKFQDKSIDNSWFSTRIYHASVENTSIGFGWFTSEPITGIEQDKTTDTKSKKIRIYPDKDQRKTLKRWLAGSRKTYNNTIDYLNQPGTKANWKGIKTGLLHSLPDWCKQVPYQIKNIAVKDACIAVQNAKKKTKVTGEENKCGFRSVKAPKQTMHIPITAVTPKGVYHTLLGSLRASEPIQTDTDCRLTYENGRWFIVVGVKVQTSATSQLCRVVALDPGIRTFLTFYSVNSCGKIGLQDFGRILTLGRHLDDLISRRTKSKSKRSRYNMRKAERRMRWKIRDLIDELHRKAAKFLLDNWDVIVIPKFETSQMSAKYKRKLRKKSVRAMMTFSHYRFLEYLKFQASLRGKVIFHQDESYTSKTASWTGEIKKSSGAKYIVSGQQKVDRDFNGARGIFLRALCEVTPLSSLVFHNDDGANAV